MMKGRSFRDSIYGIPENSSIWIYFCRVFFSGMLESIFDKWDQWHRSYGQTFVFEVDIQLYQVRVGKADLLQPDIFPDA